MEESISKAAGATFGEYVSPGEFRARIRSIDRVPAERTTTYKIRQIFDAVKEDAAAPTLQILSAQTHAPYTEGAY